MIIKTSSDISKFMVNARHNAELTLIQLAQKSGYTMQTVHNIEKSGRVHVNTFLDVMQALGVEIHLVQTPHGSKVQ